MGEFDEFKATLMSLGEAEVRDRLSQGVWANKHKAWAQDWLKNLVSSLADKRAEEDLALSEEANEIARSALEVSRKAKTISILALILSVIAIVVAVSQLISPISHP